MIEIKKIENKSAVSAIINKFDLCAEESDIIMGVFDGVDIIGAGSLSLIDYKVYLSDLKTDEANANVQMLLSLARSLLFHADLSGIKTVYCKNGNIYKICRLLRFKENNNELVLNLDGFFTSECK